MHIIRIITIKLFVLLLLLSSSSVTMAKVESDWNSAVNFKNLKTYQWLTESEQQINEMKTNQILLNEDVQPAVDSELAKKGFKKINTGAPDFWISYYATVKDKLAQAKMDAPYMAPPPQPSVDGSDWYANMRTTQTVTTKYEEGTLLILMMDPATKKLIWYGLTKDVVNPSQTPKAREAKIQTAVKQILAKFPPK